MPIKSSKKLVIDASILFAAGDKDVPQSRECRLTLHTVFSVCHHVVLTPQISAEWFAHGKSHITQQWLTDMRSRNKLREFQANNEPLRNKVEILDITIKKKQKILKDLHLIEAALVADRTVLSLDEEVRYLLCVASQEISEFQEIIWVNPINSHENCVNWLSRGARPEKQRCLANYQNHNN